MSQLVTMKNGRYLKFLIKFLPSGKRGKLDPKSDFKTSAHGIFNESLYCMLMILRTRAVQFSDQIGPMEGGGRARRYPNSRSFGKWKPVYRFCWKLSKSKNYYENDAYDIFEPTGACVRELGAKILLNLDFRNISDEFLERISRILCGTMTNGGVPNSKPIQLLGGG